jgi:predicted DNA-binding transcriptional regulator AlpA
MANVLTLEEVADYLRVHPSTVYRMLKKQEIPAMLKKQEIPAFKVGGDWRFNLESIDHWCSKAEAAKSPKDYKGL